LPNFNLMKKIINDFDVYFAVGNTNTKRQEDEIKHILKKRNLDGWKLISSSTALVDYTNQFSNLYLFWEKELH